MSDLKDLDKFIKEIQKTIDKVKDSALNKIGKGISNNLKKRMVKGIDSGTEKPFLKLAESTVKQREYKQKKGKLSNRTKPQQSNLIESGRMYDQINFRLDDEFLEIGVIGDREDVAAYNEENGRTAIALTKEDEKIIDKELEEILKKI